jgi:phosphocarrier protein HPr
MEMKVIDKTLIIVNKLGLHARASSKLVGLANKFTANIIIEKDNKKANAKSIMTVMMLAANKSSTIKLTADGIDEVAAIEALSNLINSKFGEED